MYLLVRTQSSQYQRLYSKLQISDLLKLLSLKLLSFFFKSFHRHFVKQRKVMVCLHYWSKLWHLISLENILLAIAMIYFCEKCVQTKGGRLISNLQHCKYWKFTPYRKHRKTQKYWQYFSYYQFSLSFRFRFPDHLQKLWH